MTKLERGDRLDQYSLLDLISRGGMASTFKAIDTEDGSTVAIKIPHFQYENDIVFYHRLCREETLGLRLDHPAVVKMRRPRDKSRPYVVMDFVEGRSLRAVLESAGTLSLELALDVARRLCQVLIYLHDAGVVHRDLKPDNILVRPDGGLVVIDLGLARDRAGPRITWGRPAVFGTPDYMAPERTAGKRGDARADLYAVGLVLHEMLTGKLPEDTDRMLGRRRWGPLPVRLAEVDPEIAAIVARALEPHPADRYQTARAMLTDLDDPPAPPPIAVHSGRRRLPSLLRSAAYPLTIAAVVTGLSLLIALSR